MLPTTTYIYVFKKHLFMLISLTTTKSPNVAWNGMDGTVKYLTFCQDSHTPNRFLAENPETGRVEFIDF